jgi:hypothetical protein
MANQPGKIVLTIKDATKSNRFAVHLEKKPASVMFNNIAIIDSVDLQYDSTKMKLNVKIPDVKEGELVILK